jgi:hypothetical protein
MREQPSAPELIEAVAEFLRRDVMPSLSGRTAFHARVAVNVLEIVRRELTLGPDAEAGEAARLKSLLGRNGDPDALTAALCEALAAGKMDPNDPALVEHLWATTLDTLAIDQPGYATYRRAIAVTKTETAGEPQA